MVLDLKAERLTFRQAAGRVNVHVATIWRWTLTGVKGRKLPTFLIGGRRFILSADLDAFLAGSQEQTPANLPQQCVDAAGAKLDVLFANASKGRSKPAGNGRGECRNHEDLGPVLESEKNAAE